MKTATIFEKKPPIDRLIAWVSSGPQSANHLIKLGNGSMLLADGKHRAIGCYRDGFIVWTVYVVDWKTDVRSDRGLARPVGLRLARLGYPIGIDILGLLPSLLHHRAFLLPHCRH